MCGIIHIKNLRDGAPVNATAKLVYLNQKSRGTNGYGLVGMNKNAIDTYRALRENDFLSYLTAHRYDELLLHHRLPTSTKNTYRSTHPFVIELANSRYYFVHNGIIENARELQRQHYEQGFRYQSLDIKDGTFNDSESLAWEFALYLSQQQKSVSAVGSVACMCLETDRASNRAQRLYFYRNSGSPLRMLCDSDLLVVSSEGGWGAMISEDKLWFYDYHSRTTKLHSCLTIACGVAFNWCGFPELDWCGSDDDDPFGWLGTSSELELCELEHQRDSWIRAREYRWAQELDEQIDYLRNDPGACRPGHLRV